MSTTHTLFAIAVVLSTYRLAAARPRRLKPAVSALVRAALQSAVLVPTLSSRADWQWLVAMIAVIGVSDLSIAALASAKPLKNEFTPQTIGLFIRMTAVLAVAGNPRLVPGFNAAARSLASFVRVNSAVAASITDGGFRDLLVLISGVLLAGFDVNCIVALVLRRLHLLPGGGQPDAVNRREIGRGRIIGILERSIVFVLAVRGNFSAVGLILAAKAIARFKELDQRDFAEYVLIGTLLSISLAIAAAFFLKNV